MYDDDELNDDELNELMKKIKDKIDNSPELKAEIQSLVNRLQDIFEANVELNISYDLDIENYSEEFLKYDESDILEADERSMKVDDLIEMLNDENTDYDLSIDPLYLKKGLNNIKNMLVTTYENKLILVPIIEKNEENNRNRH